MSSIFSNLYEGNKPFVETIWEVIREEKRMRRKGGKK